MMLGIRCSCQQPLFVMKIIKRIFLIILTLTIVGLVFRNWFYRHLITYKSVGLRTNYPATNRRLIGYIDANNISQNDIAIESIIKHSLALTSNKLSYTAGKNQNDPNKLIVTQKAHCVGYASFFATTCNYLLQKNGLDNTWKAKPRIGQLYFLGTNVHRYFDSPFFKDHDFVTIENKKTGQTLAVDPTVDDYLLIDFVKYSK